MSECLYISFTYQQVFPLAIVFSFKKWIKWVNVEFSKEQSSKVTHLAITLQAKAL